METPACSLFGIGMVEVHLSHCTNLRWQVAFST